MNIEEQIRRYIYKSVDKLRKAGDSVQLKCVYPDAINYVLGHDECYNNLGGYGDNYSMIIGKYKICGAMRFGIATVELIEDK